jgi:hypothetical protein
MVATIETTGVLKADGQLLLDQVPPMHLGPVRVTIAPLARLPDPPLADECISAPCDLPYPESSWKVPLIWCENYLPEPHRIEELLPK